MRLRTVIENTDYEVVFLGRKSALYISISILKKGVDFVHVYVDFFWFYLYLLAQG
jgi:hypothetical protein